MNTGEIPKLDNASIIMTYQYMSSDGYRSFSYLQRNTYYLKYVQPIGRNTTLTVVANYNNIKFNNPGTVTQAQTNVLQELRPGRQPIRPEQQLLPVQLPAVAIR